MSAALSRYANPEAPLGHAGDQAPVHADPRIEIADAPRMQLDRGAPMTALTVTVTVELTDAHAQALAQFVKRCGWSEMRACSVDDDEAYRVRDAIDVLRRSLADAGYAPR